MWLVLLLVAGTLAADFTNDFAVRVAGGEEVAELVAASHGCHLVKRLGALDNVFHFVHPKVKGRSKRSADDILHKLLTDPNVDHVEQQRVLSRHKRATVRKRSILHDKQVELPIRHVEDKSSYKLITPDDMPEYYKTHLGINFTDPFFAFQWYLINRGQTGSKLFYDINVLPVWQKGITGKGQVVSILDDGIDHTHSDLAQNYDPQASADLNDASDSDNDPMPNVSDSVNSHGTRCAGEVAAQANNSICGVGIAFNARIGGVRMLDGLVTDIVEAQALNYNFQYIDIYSASWGPADDGATIEGPGTYAAQALYTGVTKGRAGKGSIFVWATGNGGLAHDTCSCDGYVSSIYSISVGCVNELGLSTYYSELCPATLAVVFTGGSHGAGDSPSDLKSKVVTTDLHNDCTLEFQGTSSAAPLAAGCFALVLEANPELTWRDMQHLVVETAAVTNAQEDGWTMNGAGHHVNPRFGFGAIDCGKMVERAQTWVRVPTHRSCAVPADNPSVIIPNRGVVQQSIIVPPGCHDEVRLSRLEHVQLHVEVEHSYRGDLFIKLVSPSGTLSDMLTLRKLDSSDTGLNWTFMTVHCWGEKPEGEWTMVIADNPDTPRNNTGILRSWSLILCGTSDEELPQSAELGKKEVEDGDEFRPAHQAQKQELKNIMNDEVKESKCEDC